ncbi:RNA polymerase sigma factor SigJ [Ruania rhizosphaerae]|uniref:RNA polymerase sigma factor SigJ n=1 Tax=Ruania rhizosphaerae TaxID=1840413 RepID=UPI00135ACEF0|nr:RNA polymerase sigma factor SigJ [Ruania rhizosphaerae]
MTKNAQEFSEQSRHGVLARQRPVLLGLTYRMLGSFADAEDVVQEGYLRWYRLTDREREAIASPRAWLIKTTSRIALDLLGSARARRERYVGQWLPEPVPTPGVWHSNAGSATAADPADSVSVDESVSMALLVVLEAMTPAERVCFTLHDVFAYTFPEIAEIVGRSPVACRQLATSARRRVRQERRTPVAPSEHAHLVRSFKTAWQTGDLAALIAILDPDATAITDGGGLVSASLDPLRGPDAIARFFLNVLDRQPGLGIRDGLVNGEPGLIANDHSGRTLAVISFSTSGAETIDRIWAVRNPDKLGVWEQTSPLAHPTA